MIKEITDLADERVAVYGRLTEAQLRNRPDPANAVFIAESPKVIDVALRSGYEPLSLLCERRHINGDARDIISRTGVHRRARTACGPYRLYTYPRSALRHAAPGRTNCGGGMHERQACGCNRRCDRHH